MCFPNVAKCGCHFKCKNFKCHLECRTEKTLHLAYTLRRSTNIRECFVKEKKIIKPAGK